MDRWDLLIITAAGYVAITTLVRLMAARRNLLVNQVRKQIEQQRAQQQAVAQLNNQKSDQDAA